MEEKVLQKNWFNRNWKWAVPTGGCLTSIIFAVVFAGTLFMGVTTMFKESTPYNESMTILMNNETVIEQLGEPIENDGTIKGNINIQGNDGNADFEIPVKGPKGNGTLTVIAFKNDGVWAYKLLQVYIDNTNEKIDLLLKPNQYE